MRRCRWDDDGDGELPESSEEDELWRQDEEGHMG